MKSCARLQMLVLAAIGGGCASVSTVPVESTPDSTRLRRPDGIWVRPFATDHGLWQKEFSDPQKRAEVSEWLSGSLLRHLAPIAPVHLVEDELPSQGWLVSGRFLRVNPGSRTGRMFFGGVGAGASKIETQVNVYDLAVSSVEPVLTFVTTGGSNLATGLHGVLAATDDDVDRTAREIRQHLEEHLWPESAETGAASERQATVVTAVPVD